MIAHKLMDYTAEISGWESKRDYVSLSHIGEDVEVLIDQFNNGFPAISRAGKLKCYQGYAVERDLLKRIEHVFGRDTGGDTSPLAIIPNKIVKGLSPCEILPLQYHGLIRGHCDFLFDGYPADIKSLPLDEYLPPNKPVSRKIKWQMNAYMLYMGKPKALIIYQSRESGLLSEVWLQADPDIQKQIAAKCDLIYSRIKAAAR